MNYLNIHTDILRGSEFIGADPVERATWLALLGWCATQENGGVIEGCKNWKDRQWQQLAGVTAEEINTTSQLYGFQGENLVVHFYPIAAEAAVKAKREGGKKGGRPTKPKPENPPAQTPENPDEIKEKNLMVTQEDNHEDNEKKRKEMEGKENNPPTPLEGGGDGNASTQDPPAQDPPANPPPKTKRVRAQPVPIETCIELIPEEAPDWFRSIAIDWVEYRQGRKNYFDNEKSWLRQLKGMSKYPRHLLEKAVDDAIANQWQGWEQDRVKEAFKLWEERENIQYYRAG